MAHTTDLESRIRIRNRFLIGFAIVVATLVHPVLGLAVAAVYYARRVGRKQRARREAAAQWRPETPAERSDRIGRNL